MFDYSGDYPFLQLMWTTLVFFMFFMWFWLVITIFADIFRRKDAGGFAKTLWILFIIFLPLLGSLIYIIANGSGMAERNIKAQADMQKQFDDHVRTVAGSNDPTAQIANAKQLLDSGAITQAEFDALKAKALS